ncbi:Thiamine pyrophosphokinase 3 [Porphyridium purpureum]|uniref:Thiamine pyrophosphokinase 3 n=1 Tax=Porphyridium purpureum TaxID=35688 RepID=A0A5J4YYX3_PORPP|nr:Thiamine pyrophosphokinase 3 [Porphyridium purpureum]|eukprot:POR2862..scf209_3
MLRPDGVAFAVQAFLTLQRHCSFGLAPARSWFDRPGLRAKRTARKKASVSIMKEPHLAPVKKHSISGLVKTGVVSSANVRPVALLFLNGSCPRVSISPECFVRLWGRAHVRICADGGANRLYDGCSDDQNARRHAYVPSYIVGDLDSLRPEVLSYYSCRGTQIQEDRDQHSNDLMKGIRLAVQQLRHTSQETSLPDADEKSLPAMVLLGCDGGRFDHVLAALSEMHSLEYPGTLYMLSSSSWTTVLTPGMHQIELDLSCEGATCGLIPLAGACESVTTSGLQWNLNGHRLELGKFVSTSNRALESTVHVETSGFLVWTVEQHL